MAYITQEAKKVIAAKLKTIVPNTWKYSLSIDGHSTIAMRVKSSPVLIDGTDCSVNPYKLYAGEYPFVFKGETYLTVFNRHTSDLELYHFESDSMKNYEDTMEVRNGLWKNTRHILGSG